VITRGNRNPGFLRQGSEKRLGLEDLNIERFRTEDIDKVAGNGDQVVVLGPFVQSLNQRAPGPRIWDVAFAIYRFARLCELSNIAKVSDTYLDKVAQRIRRFCDYYGLITRKSLLDTVLQRLEFQIVWLSSPETVGIHRKAIADEHSAFYRRDVVAIARHTTKLGRHL
jgi:hypothetical protein